jgi:K+-transporting ATPase ATPase A chain
MSPVDLAQLGLLVALLYLTANPIAAYLENVFEGRRTLLSPLLTGIERRIYRSIGIDPSEDQGWARYARSLVVFSGVSCLFTYLLLRCQGRLPLNPQGLPAIAPDLAFTTAIGYVTNTSWQSFAGESAMSYFSQTVPLTLQFFLSPAIGIAAAVAVVRGLTRREAVGIGCFWADMVRALLYLLLPIAIGLAVVLIAQGVVQNFLPYTRVTTLQGTTQILAQGPAASQVILKVLGTNGGGFFTANAAHPYENPTAFANFVCLVAMLVIPSALVRYLGRVTRNERHGRVLWWAVCLLFLAGVVTAAYAERSGNPRLLEAGASSAANMEGKETRFGTFGSALFAVATTASSCGAVNAAHDSFTPLGGLVALVNLLLGEVIFGGDGVGLTSILTLVILTVFIAGLMVGRTPEYLGKRIGAAEIKYVVLSLVAGAFGTLAFSALAIANSRALTSLGNGGAHGISEVLYDYASATMNNGSALAGLNTNTVFWNLTLGIAMFLGRFFTLVPLLAMAGSLVRKKAHPQSAGTFPVDGAVFAGLFLAITILVGALTFFPLLSLGPLQEQFAMTHPLTQ